MLTDLFVVALCLLAFNAWINVVNCQDFLASLPSTSNNGCPNNYMRVNNGCYMFSNASAANVTMANTSCQTTYSVSNADMTASPALRGTITHLLSFESTAETVALYFWMKANGYTEDFYIDAILQQNGQYSWSWTNYGFISFGYIYNKFTGKPYTKLKLNSSNQYEINDTPGTDRGSYVCEAQVPCSASANACQNNGSCYVNGGRALCICPPGFFGILCEQQYDNCQNSPCLHGATCINLVNNYTCTCTKFYNGRDCDNSIGYIYEMQREMILAICIVFVGIMLGILCLMDLPWTEMKKLFCDHSKRKQEVVKVTRCDPPEIKEKIEKPVKLSAKQMYTSEEEMLNRFKSALAVNKRITPRTSSLTPREAVNITSMSINTSQTQLIR